MAAPRSSPRVPPPGTADRRGERLRALAWQALAIAALLAVLAWVVGNTRDNLAARGIRGGFDFLLQPAGFDIGESPLAWSSVDPYWRAFLVGLLNTLRVAIPGCVLAVVAGTLVGAARFSRSLPLRGLAQAFVESVRNVPLLVQLLTWYVLLLGGLPEATEPRALPGGMLLGKAGLALPWPEADPAGGWSWSLPQPEGFGYAGGLVLSPEYLALLGGLVLYTAAFVAEVVRGGIAAVTRGQREAALAVGLSPAQAMRLVIVPQALPTIVPPLASQLLNLTKNASLAVAIGYPDLVSVAGTALNQTGRAVECIAIVMAVYLAVSLSIAAAMALWNRRVAALGR